MKLSYAFRILFASLIFVQGYFIFFNDLDKNKTFSVNSVIDSNMSRLFFPMAIEAYADFSYIGTSISLWGVSDSKMQKIMFAEDYKRNIYNIILMNPELKDTYYMTEGHFHGINNDLNEFATDILKLGFVNIKNYDHMWELYFMAGMNTYLYSKNSSDAQFYFKKAYQLTGVNKYLRLAEISKHKNGKLFVGLMMYKKFMDNENELKLKSVYKDKFIIYQRGWTMQKNIMVFKKEKKRMPYSIEELSKFVGVNINNLKEDMLKYNLILSYNKVNGIVDITIES